MKNLVLIALSLFLFACQANTNNQATQDVENEKQTQNEMPQKEDKKDKNLYYSIVDKLNVREVPDKKGTVIGTLNFGDTFEFTGEESDFKEKITLRGKVRYDSWKKVIYEAKTGWVYGGGIAKVADMYERTDDTKYLRKINCFSSDELRDILDFELEKDFYYDGEINYRTRDNKYLKVGKFNLHAERNSGIGDVMLKIKVTGNYDDDVPHGIFEEDFLGYENKMVTTINFENGKCVWSSVIGNGEGEDYSTREENPEECSFDFIQGLLYGR